MQPTVQNLKPQNETLEWTCKAIFESQISYHVILCKQIPVLKHSSW